MVGKINTSSFVAILMTMVLTACSVDGITYEVPYAGDRLIVNGLMGPEGISVDLRHSQDPNGLVLLNDGDTVANAQIVLIDQQEQIITELDHLNRGQYRSDISLVPGQPYRVMISANDYPDAQSEDLVIPVASFDLDSAWLQVREEFFGQFNEVIFSIEDDLMSDDIFLAAPIEGRDDFITTELDDNYQAQCGILDDEGWTLWRDNCFNGESFQLRFTIANNESMLPDTVALRFGLTSQAFFDYVDQEDQPDSGLEQTFGTPNSQASNIIGGFGIIATANLQSVILTQ